MADAKLTALSAIGTLGTDDLFYVVDDPGGTPLSRKATGTQVRALVHAAPVTLTFEDATTNTVITDLILQRQSSGAPAAGIGVSLAFDVETAAANVERGAIIEAVTTDVTGAAEDFDLVLKTMFAGAAATEVLRLHQTADDQKGIFVGHPTDILVTGASTINQYVCDGNGVFAASFASFSGTANGAGLMLSHSRNETFGSHTILQDGDTLGVLNFTGSDGDEYLYGMAVDVTVDGTPANGSMPVKYQISDATAYLFVIRTGGATGIGTTAPDRKFHVEVDDATNNAVTNLSRLTHTTSGSPAAGIGIGVEYEVETSASNNEIGAILEVYVKDATAASEDFGVRWKTMTAGAAALTSLDFSLPGTVYPQGHLFGLTLSNDAGDTTNDINITAGEAVDETGVWNMVLPVERTKRIDATWVVGDDQGGMANNGTGVADTTWYEVLLIGREDTRVVDVAFSTTANRAVLPTSYTHKRRIGWVRRGASTNLQFTQVDDYVTLTTQINDASTSITATAAALTLTAPPSSIARFRASLLLTAQTIANETIVVFSEIVEGNVTPAGSTGIASLGAGAQNATSANNDFTSAGHFELRVSATSTIEHDGVVGAGAAGTHDVSTFGWIDHRRRMSAT